MSQQAVLFLMCVFKRYPFCSGVHLKLANIPLHSISWKQNIRNDIIWRLFSWFLWFLTIWQNLISCFSRSYNFWRWCACFWYTVLLWIISLRQYNQWGPITVPNRPYETFSFFLTNPSDEQLCLICKYGFMSWVCYSCEFYIELLITFAFLSFPGSSVIHCWFVTEVRNQTAAVSNDGLVTDQLGNGSLGFVNMCLVLIQQSGRADDNADLDAVLLPDNSNYTYDYFRLSHLSCIKNPL